MDRSLFDNNDDAGQHLPIAESLQMDDQNRKQAFECKQAFEKENANGQKPTSRKVKARLEQTGYRCELSGVKLSPETVTLDHMVPLSKGGKHAMNNLQVVHEVVNTMKGTMRTEEFIEWCRLIADHNTNSSE